MGKSTKKSASKVAVAAPAPAPAPAKSLKKGKREADVLIEKELVSAKKQKASEKKSEIKPEKKNLKRRVESEQKSKAKVTPKNGKSDSESHSDSSDVEEDAPKKPTPVAAKSGKVAAPPSIGRSDEDVVPTKKAKASVAKKAEEEIDDEEAQKKKIKAKKAEEEIDKIKAKKAEEEIDDEEAQKKKIKASPEKSSGEDEPAPKTPKTNDTDATPKEQSIGGGSKTLFVKNLSFQVQKAEVVEFFKPAGEVVDVRLAMNREDDSFKGYGHVEFATAEQAEKALVELNGKELLHRAVKLDIAREEKKGEHKQSFKRRPKLEVFVTGFDAYDGEDNIRASLMAHFASCGEIARVSIPTGKAGISIGIAYVQFLDENARSKALELGNSSLAVEEPRPRADSSNGGFGSGHGRGRGRGGRGRGFNNRPSKATVGED